MALALALALTLHPEAYSEMLVRLQAQLEASQAEAAALRERRTHLEASVSALSRQLGGGAGLATADSLALEGGGGPATDCEPLFVQLSAVGHVGIERAGLSLATRLSCYHGLLPSSAPCPTSRSGAGARGAAP